MTSPPASPRIGDPAPDFDLPATQIGRFSPQDARGQWLALFFYPKDDTPGCTQEALSFHEAAADLAARNGRAVGVSRDDLASHDRFARKHGLSVPLCADVEGAACAAYGVWVEKKMYGRTFMGIERATFLIDPDGRVRQVWRKVRVAGHAAEVVGRMSTG